MKVPQQDFRSITLTLVLFTAGSGLYAQTVHNGPRGPFPAPYRPNQTSHPHGSNQAPVPLGGIHASPPGGEQAAALSENTKGPTKATKRSQELAAREVPLPPLFGRAVGRLLRYSPEGIVLHQGPLEQDFMKLGQIVRQGDLLETNGAGRARIVFYRGLALSLGPRSSLKVEAFDAARREVRLNLPGGSISTAVAPKAEGWKFHLSSSTATMDGSGRLEIYDSPYLTYVCVAGGQATVRNAKPDTGRRLKLRPQQCARVIASGSPMLAANAPKLIREISKATDTSKAPDDDLAFLSKRP